VSLDVALDPRTLEAAMRGDERAFEDLIAPYRAELHAHCYRMLGSLHDAEDALQDGLLRSWRGLARFEGRSSLRSWLYRIATNSCLRMIERRPRRVLPTDYGPAADARLPTGEPLVESTWIEPLPDVVAGIPDGRAGPEARYEQRESVELAFVAALQHLPARQRAVLILRDVLGFAPAEIAEALDTSAAAVSSALQRAHRTIDERLPEQSQQATLRALGDERLRSVVATYADAWERGDVDAILAMLTQDAAFAMPPRATWYRGPEAIGAFLARAPLVPGRRWRFVPTSAGGQPAFGTYQWAEQRQRWEAHAIDVLTVSPDGRIAEITAFIDAAPFRRFGLPDHFRE
jgi:RNA polymerase sigma-70 factor (ECF subfamily)